MKQRANGEGSIYQVGNRWVAAITVGPKRRIERRAATEREARAILRQLIAQRDAGAIQTGTRQSVQTWLDHWITVTRKHDLRPHTRAQYESNIRVHLVPALGAISLAQLSPLHIDRLKTDMCDRGYAPTTVNLALRILTTALNDAVRYGLLTKSPAAPVSAVSWRASERPVLSAAAAAALIRHAEGTEWHALWSLLLGIGLRIGEALALSWPDVAGGVARIRHTITSGDGKHGLWLGPPKTAMSVRDLVIPQPAQAALRAHSPLVKRRQAATRSWAESDLIFPGRFGAPMHEATAQHALTAHLEAIGEPRVTLHALRHTCATLLRDAGVPIEDVARLLGHTGIGLVGQLYSHTPAHRQRANAERLATVLWQRSS